MSMELTAVVALDHSKFSSGLSSIQSLCANTTGAMMAAFGGVSTEILAMGKAFGTVGVAVATLKEVSTAGMGVQQSIANLRAETGFTSTEIKGLTDLAMSMSTKMTAGTGEIVKAMAALHANGSETADMIRDTLTPALELADVAGMDMAAAADVMNTTMKNFGLTAKDSTEFVNLLAEASNPVEMQAFTDALLKASQTAQGYGISVKETVAMMKLFEEAGMEGGKAGQAFSMVMDKLSDAAKKMEGQIGAALAGWKPSVEGMAGALDRLKSSGVSTQEVLDAFGPRVGGAMVKMLNEGGPALRELASNLENGKTMAGLYEAKNATLGASLKTLGNTIENLNVSAFIPMADALKNMIGNIQDVIQWVGKLASAMISGNWSTVRSMFSDLWVDIISGVQGAFEKVREYAGKMADTFKNLNWGDSFSTLKTTAIEAWNKVWTEAQTAVSKISTFLKGQDWGAVWESAKSGFITAVNFWYSHLAEVWGKIASFLKGVDGAALWESVRSGAVKAWSEIESIVKSVLPSIQQYAENVWNTIATAANLAWDMIKQAWNTVDWSKVMDDIKSGFDSAIEKVKAFGQTLAQNLGLSQTFSALSGLLGDLKVSFGNALSGAKELFAFLSNVNWSSILQGALKAIDTILAGLITTVDLALKGINGLVAGWQSLSDGTKAVLAVYAGTAGIVGAFILFVDIVGKASVAMTAFAFAMQGSVISALETFYIKLMLVNTSMTSFPILAGGMVAAAGAIGVGLGLLIRQIPGVADALDKLTVKVGEFCGWIEKEDPILKANAERLAKLRQENSDMIIAQEKARQATESATQAAEAQAEAMNAQDDAAAELRNQMIKAAGAVETFATAGKNNSAFLDTLTGKSNEAAAAMANEIIIMRQFAPASADMGIGLDNLSKSMSAIEPAAKAMQNAFNDIRNVNFQMKIELPEMTNMKVAVWGSFFEMMKSFAGRVVDVKISLPDMRNNLVEIWGNFFNMLEKHAGKSLGVDIKLPDNFTKMTNRLSETWGHFFEKAIPVAGKAVTVSISELPNLTNTQVDLWGKFFGFLSGKSMGDIKIPEAPNLTTNLASIDKSLQSLVAMKGVVWA